MFTVPPKVQTERLSICHSCPHFKKATGSCGTLIVGNALTAEQIAQAEKENTVTRNKSKKRLCGCVMRIKTRLILAECPLNKWGKYEVTEQTLKEMRKFIDGLNGRSTMTAEEVHKLYGYASSLSGVRMTPTTCGSCVKEVIDKMRQTIKERG
jgi:hypothetical protein